MMWSSKGTSWMQVCFTFEPASYEKDAENLEDKKNLYNEKMETS